VPRETVFLLSSCSWRDSLFTTAIYRFQNNIFRRAGHSLPWKKIAQSPVFLEFDAQLLEIMVMKHSRYSQFDRVNDRVELDRFSTVEALKNSLGQRTFGCWIAYRKTRPGTFQVPPTVEMGYEVSRILSKEGIVDPNDVT
jgi:hypothetical protein